MGRAVLISIQPKWCAMITQGKKILEVRKNRPKIETPFKCYIYCTKDKANHFGLESGTHMSMIVVTMRLTKSETAGL